MTQAGGLTEEARHVLREGAGEARHKRKGEAEQCERVSGRSHSSDESHADERRYRLGG